MPWLGVCSLEFGVFTSGLWYWSASMRAVRLHEGAPPTGIAGVYGLIDPLVYAIIDRTVPLSRLGIGRDAGRCVHASDPECQARPGSALGVFVETGHGTPPLSYPQVSRAITRRPRGSVDDVRSPRHLDECARRGSGQPASLIASELTDQPQRGEQLIFLDTGAPRFEVVDHGGQQLASRGVAIGDQGCW